MRRYRKVNSRNALVFLAVFVIAVLALACSPSAAQQNTPSASTSKPLTLRLGYFPNITHSQPLIGLKRGTFASSLPSNVTLETRAFNAGPSAIEALFAGAIDMTYIGPNPAINGYVQSEGKELRIIAGATSAGALFVVRPDSGIHKPEDLAGKKIATPQLGNTQDVALRAYLLDHGLASREQRGNVQVMPTTNSQALTLFQKGDVHGAWVPEPWGTRLLNEAGGRLFLDERTLWPNGDFVTTHLIVRTKFLEEHPGVVRAFLKAHVETTQWTNANPQEATRLVNEGIKDVTGVGLDQATIDAAWKNLKVTWDPVAASLRKSASDAYRLGFLGTGKEPDLSNIYALDALDQVLQEKGLPGVAR